MDTTMRKKLLTCDHQKEELPTSRDKLCEVKNQARFRETYTLQADDEGGIPGLTRFAEMPLTNFINFKVTDGNIKFEFLKIGKWDNH